MIAVDVVDAAAGYRHGVFLRADGSVWTFGSNQQGQLGNPDVESGSAPVQVMRNCVSVASTHSTCAALSASGDLYTWGDNSCGQIGNGRRGNGGLTESDLITPAPYLVMSKIREVRLGASEASGADDHFSATNTENVRYVWGGRCPNSPTPYADWIEERLPIPERRTAAAETDETAARTEETT